MFDAVLAMIGMVAAGQAPAEVAVDVGRANWEIYPQLPDTRMVPQPAQMVDALAGILRNRQCTLPGQDERNFDVVVRYIVLVNPDGTASRAVVNDVGCRPLETLVGSLVVRLSGLRAFGPTGRSEARWYGGSFNFTHETFD
jgi:hypothetical protein